MNTQPPYPPGDLPQTWQPARPDEPADDGTKKGRRAKKKAKGSGDEGDSGPTRRVVSRTRLMAIVLAVVAALAVWLGSSGDTTPGTYVVQAAGPIGALTEIAPSDLTAVPVDEAQVLDDAVTGATASDATAAFLAEYEGASTIRPVTTGEQLRASMLTLDRALDTDLGPDERLVSVSAVVQAAVAGKLRVGDHVDIYGIETSEALAGLVAADIELVAVTVSQQQYESLSSQQTDAENRDKQAEELLPGDPIPGIYTLKVPARLAGPLTLLSEAGSYQLALAYRAPGSADTELRALTGLDVICGALLGTSDPAALPEQCAGIEVGQVGQGPGTTLPGGDLPGDDTDDAGQPQAPGTTLPGDEGAAGEGDEVG